jgi:predicted protein tyrosine phosphatase
MRQALVSHLGCAMIGLPQRALVDVTPNLSARAATLRAFSLAGARVDSAAGRRYACGALNVHRSMPDIRHAAAPPLIPYKITICGLVDLPGLCDGDVTHLLSLLDFHHPLPETLDGFSGADCELLRFDDVVAEFPGFTACSVADVERILTFGDRMRAAGAGARHLVVHCHAGISRSTAAAAVLMAQFNPGRETEAFLALLDMRPHAWPNTRVVELADRILARQGALLEGLAAYRRALLERKPQLRQVIVNIGRGHELP